MAQSIWERIKEAWQGNQYTQSQNMKAYDFENMKQLVLNPNPNKIIIDVREADEYSSVHIPGAHNVPHNSHPEAWKLEDSTFKKSFGFKKPDMEGPELIFYCKAGFRSKAAAEKAAAVGYSNVSTYPGSIDDWLANGGYKL